jgi:ADP-ribosyl-[dinitrogen reductase] hydrolase
MKQGDVGARFRGCLLGLAVGDAVGTTAEFKPRGTFEPLIDMVGGGPFNLDPGQWTDDTSMALCLATSLVERGEFDPHDQMTRYWRWRSEGYLSSTGVCFDIGRTTALALRRFRETGDPFAGSADPDTAGNGCIMRLAPVPMFFFPDESAAVAYAADSSRTTHAADECLDAVRFLASVLVRALAGAEKEEILIGRRTFTITTSGVVAIARGAYLPKLTGDVRASGHVVACLEAALWAFARAESFEEAILTAANLGDDADTTAAVCGQVAGAFYGESAIPARWLQRLTMRDEIREVANRLNRC